MCANIVRTVGFGVIEMIVPFFVIDYTQFMNDNKFIRHNLNKAIKPRCEPNKDTRPKNSLFNWLQLKHQQFFNWNWELSSKDGDKISSECHTRCLFAIHSAVCEDSIMPAANWLSVANEANYIEWLFKFTMMTISLSSFLFSLGSIVFIQINWHLRWFGFDNTINFSLNMIPTIWFVL